MGTSAQRVPAAMPLTVGPISTWSAAPDLFSTPSTTSAACREEIVASESGIAEAIDTHYGASAEIERKVAELKEAARAELAAIEAGLKAFFGAILGAGALVQTRSAVSGRLLLLASPVRESAKFDPLRFSIPTRESAPAVPVVHKAEELKAAA